MTEEIFDVVNERDEVIGQQSRSEVHRLGLMHRAVHVLVFNAAGQVFLQKRSMKKDRQPGLWDSSASGHVDSGEDYDACAVRELREEIGLQLGEAPAAAVQAGRLRRNRPGTCLGLSLRSRRAVPAGPGGNRARRLVRARRSHALDGGTATGIRERPIDDLEEFWQERAALDPGVGLR